MNYDLRSYVKIYNNFLSPQFYGDITNRLKSLKQADWELHSYHIGDKSYSHENDLSISYFDFPEKLILKTVLWDLMNRYFEDMNEITAWWPGWEGYSEVRFNKYENGTEMRIHGDHIKTLFEGKDRGVPILSIVGSLNDDYEGGELVMWGDQVIPLKAGSVMIFPSNFMYPHQVNVVTKGVRYSYVSWVW